MGRTIKERVPKATLRFSAWELLALEETLATNRPTYIDKTSYDAMVARIRAAVPK